MKLKQFKKIEAKQFDVLIVGEYGIDYIMKCIPKECSVAIVNIDRTIPYIFKLSFFAGLLQKLIQAKVKYVDLLSVIVEKTNPKIIITFLDNGLMVAEIGYLFPDKMIIYIQNGVRSNSHIDIGSWGKEAKLPNYYGFGEYEKDMFELKGVTIERYKAVGSMRMSRFLSSNDNRINSIKKKQVCFVSQFRINLLNTKDQLLIDFLKLLKQLYKNLVIWGAKNNIKIVVAMFYSLDEYAHREEMLFYESISNEYSDVEYSINNRQEMSSYKVGMESEVVMAMDSTLGYELFGCGCKLLFCIGSDRDFLVRWGGEGNLSNMPELVLLHSLDIEHFDARLDKLFYASYQSYLLAVKNARSYYMKCDKNLAYTTIKNDIQYFIDSKEL